MTQHHEEQLEALASSLARAPWALPRTATVTQAAILASAFLGQEMIMPVTTIMGICSHRLAIAAGIYKRY